jgi:hypothetical protein
MRKEKAIPDGSAALAEGHDRGMARRQGARAPKRHSPHLRLFPSFMIR